MSEEILVDVCESIMTLTLNRPERKNALNLAMYTTLSESLDRAAKDDEIRVVFFKGAGDSFTSGNDLSDFASGASLAEENNPIRRFLFTLVAFPKPVVVAVHGVAVGIGTTLLLHSDLVYAASSASFRMPFVNLGLCPEFASSLLVPRLAGHAKASEWLLLGEFFSATDALTGGLVNVIVDDPQTFAMQQCQKLAKQPPAALRNAKALIKAPDSAVIMDTINSEIKVFGEALKGAEFSEAVTAFFEKRPANFSSANFLSKKPANPSN
ncbi:MAG: enoyl-CoA hydratase/carnithine racemase [Lentisphaeria bacterium]|jgi:enoyl-CoA hydratase/carnithine racemase